MTQACFSNTMTAARLFDAQTSCTTASRQPALSLGPRHIGVRRDALVVWIVYESDEGVETRVGVEIQLRRDSSYLALLHRDAANAKYNTKLPKPSGTTGALS
jgi:hypothetical protein